MAGSNINIFNIGTVLNDKYVILEFIGKGGMGEVYRAHQAKLRRDVAIKVISREFLANMEENKEETEAVFQRFRNEVLAMAQIRHPNVLQIFDFDSVRIRGQDDIQVEFIVMEYIPGGSLRATMSEEGFAPQEDLTRRWLRDYFFPVLDGVQAMHRSDMVHRDLKPENVFIDTEVPKIADFGLAHSHRLKPVTQSMDVKGTLPYMSPEQFYDLKRADFKADVYSLGKILCEAIEGRISSKTVPFKQAHLTDPKTGFFKALDRIIRSATAEKKEERIESVESFRKDLLEAMSMAETKDISRLPVSKRAIESISNQKWTWTGITVAILSVLIMTLWHIWGNPERSMRSPPPTSRQSQLESSKAETTPARSIVAEDGVTLQLIPGGEIDVPQNFGPESGQKVKVAPFYMDEIPVTNLQYVDFLNQILSKVDVNQGMVRVDGKMILFLGKFADGHEPIVFRDGSFRIQNPEYASYPVLRVTGYGASAYAHFYGRRLPTETEWLFAAKKGVGTAQNVSPGESELIEGDQMHRLMHQPAAESPGGDRGLAAILKPVTELQPNAFGVKGMPGAIGEWEIRASQTGPNSAGKNMNYVISGRSNGDAERADPIPPPVPHDPWEGFEDVGFRCVQNLTGSDK